MKPSIFLFVSLSLSISIAIGNVHAKTFGNIAGTGGADPITAAKAIANETKIDTVETDLDVVEVSQTVQDADIATIKTEQTIQDTTIALKADQVDLLQEITDRTDADLLKVDKADKATTANVVAGVADKWVDSAELKTALDALTLTGEGVKPFADTFAGLGTIPAEPVDGNFWTILTEEDGTNKAGIYLATAGEAVWSFGAELGRDVLEVLPAWIEDAHTDYATAGLISAERVVEIINQEAKTWLSIPAGGAVEIGKHYNGVAGDTLVVPTLRADGSAIQAGDWFRVINTSPLKSGYAIPFNAGIDLSVVGFPTTSYAHPAGKDLEYVFNGVSWDVPTNSSILVPLTDADNGTTLIPGHKYIIKATTELEFFLSARPFGLTTMRLESGSTAKVTIKQNTAVVGDQITDESGVLNTNEFDLPLSFKGQAIQLEGDAINNKWGLYRPWEQQPPSMVHRDGGLFDLNAFFNDNHVVADHLVQITNTSEFSGLAVTLDGTRQLELKSGTSTRSSIPASTGFTIRPNAVATVSYNNGTVHATISASRDRGFFTSIELLDDVPANSIQNGDWAHVDQKTYIYNVTSLANESPEVVKPSDLLVTSAGRWLTPDSDSKEVLESITVTFRGILTSATSAVDLVFADINGVDYDMLDWEIVSDSENILLAGGAVIGASFAPPVNGDRAVKFRYKGAVQKQGLSAVTATFRSTGSTGIVKVATSYFSGDVYEETFTGGTANTATYNVNGSTNVDFTTLIVNTDETQDVLPDWQAGQAYTSADTKVVGIAPANVDPQIAGNAYILRPQADLTSAGTLDFTEWGKYDVLGEYKLNGSTFRTATADSTEILNFFDIKSSTEGNTRIIPEGITMTYRLGGIADINFNLNDNTGGLVTDVTGGTSQDFTVTGPAFLFHTLNGNLHQVEVYSGETTEGRNRIYGSYAFAADGVAGFAWGEQDSANTAGNITNNGTTGHVLSGGKYKITYSAQKQTNSGTAGIIYTVDGVNAITGLFTGENAGTSFTHIVDASTADKTIRFYRAAASGQGNTVAQLLIERIGTDFVKPADYVIDDAGAVAGDTAIFADNGAGGLKLVKGTPVNGLVSYYISGTADGAGNFTYNYPTALANNQYTPNCVYVGSASVARVFTYPSKSATGFNMTVRSGATGVAIANATFSCQVIGTPQ